jgi:glutamate synthase (NADPH/NADH) large chain
VKPSPQATFQAEDNVILGNTSFYGATSGEAYINGIAGERFAVRNSGANVVVEGVGDHGCEYMTGGVVAVLGGTGRNFAAGMSGGIAYVLDIDGDFNKRCNQEMVLLEQVEDALEAEQLRSLIERHVYYTESAVGTTVLNEWQTFLPKFVRVIPKDYKKMLAQISKVHAEGLQGEAALLAAFEASTRELAGIGN